MSRRLIRGRLVWLEGDPREQGPGALRDIEDGLVLVEDGRIGAVGDAGALLPHLSDLPVDDWRPCLVVPGLIDTHIHYPQVQVIASYGTQLLEWLQRYTFPEEVRFGDPALASRHARFFLDELLANGTTTAVVYCTSHPGSAEALLAEARARRMRLIAGKVMMDREGPEGLLDTAERGYTESRELIARWHGVDRLGYAVTPRFAVTSTDAQLEAAGAHLKENPGCWMQTHLAENRAEILTVRKLFPWSRSYTDVYDHFGLLGRTSLLGHCIHLDEDERRLLAGTGSVACFCPTSNLFIGSGLFDMAAMRDPTRPVRIGLATDVGGGTSYSMLRTAAEAYKVLQLQGQDLSPQDALYMLTLGNARAIGLDDRIGRLAPGYEADITVLDPAATPAMAHRLERADGRLADILFLLVTMGDDRSTRATYVLGEPAGRAGAARAGRPGSAPPP